MPKIKTAASVKRKKSVSAKKATPKKAIRKKVAPKVTKGKKTAKVIQKKVSPIPKSYHSITPYLIVDNGKKAIEFYKKAFKAKLGLTMEQPNGKKIHHAELTIGDSKFMLADEHPELNARSPKAFGGSPMNIHLYVKNVDKVIAQAVAAGAKLLSPVADLFYGDRCGRIEDPYGYQWHIATHIEDVSTRELKKRSAQFFNHKD